MYDKKTPTILIIVGITGDLARRKLIPALIKIKKALAVPDKFHIIGTSRQTDVSKEELFLDIEGFEEIADTFTVLNFDPNKEEEYQKLKQEIGKIEHSFNASSQAVFYLSIPPRATIGIVKKLATAGFAEKKSTKILLEKPFGGDLKSAKELIERINIHFSEEQIYRIDHYLAKEMSQNIAVFRERNSLFRRTWNNKFIQAIEISATESIGIEERVTFYEQTGALRDLVQSHLLQLAALTLLDINQDDMDLPRRRALALESLSVARNKEGKILSKRGQYEGYKKEVNNLSSLVETYVSLTLESSDPRWIDVPIVLTTGKKMSQKSTEIKILYKKDHETESNELVLHLQPNEGVEIVLWSKLPGYQKKIEKKSLKMKYQDDGITYEAYEQVLIDVIHSDHNLFISDKEVMEEWRIISPLQEQWSKSSEDLFTYPCGSSVEDLGIK